MKVSDDIIETSELVIPHYFVLKKTELFCPRSCGEIFEVQTNSFNSQKKSMHFGRFLKEKNQIKYLLIFFFFLQNM